MSITEPKLRKFGEHLLVVFSFCLFTDKGPINISFGLLLLLSISYMSVYWKKELFTENRFALILLAPLVIGIFFSFFSHLGLKGPLAFFLRFRALFLILPFVLFVTEKKTVEKILIAMNIGAFFNVAYSFYNTDFSKIVFGLIGMQKIGRSSDMLFVICAFNIIFLVMCGKKSFEKKKWLVSLLFANTFFLFSAVALIGQRGAWIGLYFTVFAFLLFYHRKLLGLMILTTIIFSFFLPPVWMKAIKSISDTKKDRSNMVRLSLNKIGASYILDGNSIISGTGGDNAQEIVTKYIESKDEDYQKRYLEVFTKKQGNFHNSLMQMAVEGGMLFLVSYLAAIAYLVSKMIKKAKFSKMDSKVYLVAGIFVPVGFIFSQIVHEELFKYAGFVNSLILYSGAFIENQLSGMGVDTL